MQHNFGTPCTFEVMSNDNGTDISSPGYFSTFTFQSCRCSSTRTFRHRDFSAQGFFDNGRFGMETFQYMDISAQ